MVVKMEQKELNNLSAEELDAMADALLAADDAKQAETKAAPAADEPAEDKPVAEKPESEKTTEEKLNELVEKGKKAGKLSSKDLMVLEDMNLSSEETEKFYDQLESLNIDVLSDDALPPVDEDALPELEELQEIEEVTEEEMNETEAMADTFSTDDPVRMYLKEIGKVDLLTAADEVDLAMKIEAGVAATEELEKAEEEDFCFVERENLAGYEGKITEIVLYKWNRDYPADVFFEVDLSKWRLEERKDFSGYSHEKITKELINATIDTVYVYDKKRIEVVFSFDDVLMKAIEKYQKGVKEA